MINDALIRQKTKTDNFTSSFNLLDKIDASLTTYTPKITTRSPSTVNQMEYSTHEALE